MNINLRGFDSIFVGCSTGLLGYLEYYLLQLFSHQKPSAVIG
uniref:Uncharacterized protein n=1 Tax=Arundo donax TaxID=35708 RepID=A0A0A9T0R4_ARUDO